MQVENSTFLISGGGSGLGAACARRLAGAGANVVIADINPAAGESVAGAIGARARFVRVDVTDEASVTTAQNAASSEKPATMKKARWKSASSRCVPDSTDDISRTNAARATPSARLTKPCRSR